MAGRTQGAQLDPQCQKEVSLGFSSWVEVDLSALEHNLQTAASRTAASILPILKSDAYGHGAPVVAAFLRGRGCSTLGVSGVEEALDILRWIRADIILLTPPLPSQLPLVVQHGLTATVTTSNLARELNDWAKRSGKRITVHIKVDTGLGRLGAAPQDVPELARLIINASHLKLGGVFTHFSAAARSRRFTLKQLHQLLSLQAELRSGSDLRRVLWHAANSAAFITLPASHLDVVRLGTLLYGQAPLALDGSWNLAQTWQFKTCIIQVRVLPPGHTVGYGLGYRTTRPTRVGVIPVGYSHGLELEPQSSPWRQIKQAAARALIQGSPVFHGSTPLAILGRVSMGLTCLDISGTDLDVGDTVTVHMRRTVVSRQIPRLYYVQGKLKCIFWNHQLFSPQGRRISLKGLF